MTKKVNIMVIDDEEIMHSLFRDILQDEGYEVITVSCGIEAEKKAKETFFDIVFIDIHMPVMNGLETLRAIRQVSPETTFIMMDSYPDYLLAESVREGAISCIHKPFDIEEVKSIIRKIIKKEKGE